MSYEYSLRYALDPAKDNEERIEELILFCREAQIDEVNFFINHEEIGRGHISLQETVEWMKASLQLKERLAKEQIGFSLNPGITLMHGDRGRVVDPLLGIQTMVDRDGTKASAVACPGDPIWQEYIAKTYGIYASVEPEYLWLEDDFRHFNHKPVLWGCFCDAHMERYQVALGQEISRESFVEQILKPGEPTKARQVYLDICRNEMNETAFKIEQAVHAVSPQTKLALMTSQPEEHATEGRDWQEIFEKLSGDQAFVARPHLPSYNEVTPKVYNNGFNRVSRITAHLLGDDSVLYPELENYMYSRYAKSNQFSRFQLESSLILHPKGSTMNLFDMMGTGVVRDYQLQTMLSEAKPFLTRISALDLRISEQRGIHVLYGTRGSYSIRTKEGARREELIPREDSWLALLGAFGISSIPATYSKALKNQVVAVSGQYLRQLANEEIEQLVTENFMLFDGESVEILVDRNLGNLIGVESCEWLPVRSGRQSYEQVDNGQRYCGVKEARLTLMQQVGDYLKIKYNQAPKQVISNAYNEYHEIQGPYLVQMENCLILPVAWDEKDGWNSQYISLREAMVKEVITGIKPSYPKLAMTNDMPYCNLYHYQKEGKTFYIIANFSTERYKAIECQLITTKPELIEHSRQGEKMVAYDGEKIQTAIGSYELKVFEVK
ncbi:hypothetical protein [Enterococcus sp.]|uniref:hypothetical protein n=1 Tax=Enterococcus sp. TaxID=35783 RepID=UPI002FCC13A1